MNATLGLTACVAKYILRVLGPAGAPQEPSYGMWDTSSRDFGAAAQVERHQGQGAVCDSLGAHSGEEAQPRMSSQDRADPNVVSRSNFAALRY